MDFLTQPFSRAAAPPRSAPAPSPSPPSTSSSPSVPVVHHRQPDDETASVVTTSTEGIDDRFAQLRTAPPPMGPVPGEAILQVPSTKAGDWLAYGRVSAHVVLWDDGTVGESKKLRDEVIKEEWIVEGTLSLTKDDQILLIIDRDVPPLPVLVSGPSKSSRRLSFGRRKSLTPGSSEATSATSETVASPCRSLDDASPTSRAREHEQEDSDPWQTEGGFSERGSSSGRGGFGGFVKKIVGAVRSTSRGRTKTLEQPQQQSDDGTGTGTGLGLTRTITGGSEGRRRAVGAATTGQQEREQEQRTGPPSDYGSRPEALQLKFDEPAAIDKNPSPFPTYKNHPVTALCISSPSYIHALRFYPQRTLSPVAASESGLYSFPFLFGPATARDAPISSPPGSPSLCSYPGSIAVQPPVVELDVAVPGQYLEAEHPQARDEGRKREVTVGFVFKEVMMATEADDFKSRLEGKLGGAPLRRIGSGSSGEKGQGSTPGVAQRRKSWAFSSG
ncbi:hypothetical protein JCM1840_001505 [Sporobolomyces johnsonii]